MDLNKIIIFLILGLVSISLGTITYGMSLNYVDQQKKIDFLENALATKNLEYEWLSEVTNCLLYCDEDKKKSLFDEYERKFRI